MVKAISSARKQTAKPDGPRYEAVKLEGLYSVLDGIAWMDAPTTGQLAQFAGADPRTVGKLLKNATRMGLVAKSGPGYVLLTPYPYKGTPDQKQHVLREALVRLPLLVSMRQFKSLGESDDHALRKAATITESGAFSAGDFAPLLDWAMRLGALEAGLVQQHLVESAQAEKAARHVSDRKSRIAFLSHSSSDKPFIRQLAADLTAAGVSVWLDEQRIKVGESIPEKISQGLAESDYFLLAMSRNSIESEWVKKELNGALMNEVQRRAVHIFPLKLDDSPLPQAISDKRYADFSQSYKEGLSVLLAALREDEGE